MLLKLQHVQEEESLKQDTNKRKEVTFNPIPDKIVKEEDEVVRPGVALCQIQNLHWGDRDGDSIVEISSPWHLRVDDESWVPRVAPALCPDQVQWLQGNVQS